MIVFFKKNQTYKFLTAQISKYEHMDLTPLHTENLFQKKCFAQHLFTKAKYYLYK